MLKINTSTYFYLFGYYKNIILFFNFFHKLIRLNLYGWYLNFIKLYFTTTKISNEITLRNKFSKYIEKKHTLFIKRLQLFSPDIFSLKTWMKPNFFLQKKLYYENPVFFTQNYYSITNPTLKIRLNKVFNYYKMFFLNNYTIFTKATNNNKTLYNKNFKLYQQSRLHDFDYLFCNDQLFRNFSIPTKQLKFRSFKLMWFFFQLKQKNIISGTWYKQKTPLFKTSNYWMLNLHENYKKVINSKFEKQDDFVKKIVYDKLNYLFFINRKIFSKINSRFNKSFKLETNNFKIRYISSLRFFKNCIRLNNNLFYNLTKVQKFVFIKTMNFKWSINIKSFYRWLILVVPTASVYFFKNYTLLFKSNTRRSRTTLLRKKFLFFKNIIFFQRKKYKLLRYYQPEILKKRLLVGIYRRQFMRKKFLQDQLQTLKNNIPIKFVASAAKFIKKHNRIKKHRNLFKNRKYKKKLWNCKGMMKYFRIQFPTWPVFKFASCYLVPNRIKLQIILHSRKFRNYYTLNTVKNFRKKWFKRKFIIKFTKRYIYKIFKPLRNHLFYTLFLVDKNYFKIKQKMKLPRIFINVFKKKSNRHKRKFKNFIEIGKYKKKAFKKYIKNKYNIINKKLNIKIYRKEPINKLKTTYKYLNMSFKLAPAQTLNTLMVPKFIIQKLKHKYTYWFSYFYSWSWAFLFGQEIFVMEHKLDWHEVRSRLFFNFVPYYHLQTFQYNTSPSFKLYKTFQKIAIEVNPTRRPIANSWYNQSINDQPQILYGQKSKPKKLNWMLIKNHYSKTLRKERQKVNIFFKLKYRYQHRLTNWLFYFKIFQGFKAMVDNDLTISKVIQNSKLISGYENTLYILNNHICFVNGYIVTNEWLPVFRGDIILFKLNWYIYLYIIYSRKNYTYSNILVQNFHHHKQMKYEHKKPISWDFVYHTDLNTDIPYFLEIDYLTLSSYILLEPDLLYLLRQNIYKVTYAPLASLFSLNWKYIV